MPSTSPPMHLRLRLACRLRAAAARSRAVMVGGGGMQRDEGNDEGSAERAGPVAMRR